MAGSKSARRAANAAAEQARQEAARFRHETDLLKRRTEDERLRAQRILMRALRSRGGGIFESDFLSQFGSTLGGTGTLG